MPHPYSIDHIYLVRHGQSLGNIDPTIYREHPDHDISLSDLGRTQAQGAANALLTLLTAPSNEPVRLWTSPYRRTRQTADPIQEALSQKYAKFDRREHINLCEQQFGLFDGVPDSELPVLFPREHAHYDKAQKHEGRFWARMPLGESRFDVAVRVHQSFGTFHRDSERHGIRNLIIVCHGVTLRAFVMQWLHLPYEWFDQQPNPGNCDIYHLPGDPALTPGYVYKNGVLI